MVKPVSTNPSFAYRGKPPRVACITATVVSQPRLHQPAQPSLLLLQAVRMAVDGFVTTGAYEH